VDIRREAKLVGDITTARISIEDGRCSRAASTFASRTETGRRFFTCDAGNDFNTRILTCLGRDGWNPGEPLNRRNKSPCSCRKNFAPSLTKAAKPCACAGSIQPVSQPCISEARTQRPRQYSSEPRPRTVLLQSARPGRTFHTRSRRRQPENIDFLTSLGHKVYSRTSATAWRNALAAIPPARPIPAESNTSALEFRLPVQLRRRTHVGRHAVHGTGPAQRNRRAPRRYHAPEILLLAFFTVNDKVQEVTSYSFRIQTTRRSW